MYIKPRLKVYNTFEELNKNEPFIGSYFGEKDTEEFENLITYKRLIVLAEPGYGKSELLRQLAKNSLDNSIIVELKKFQGESSISQLIEKECKIAKRNFNLVDDEKIVVCLDALDEVRNHLLEDLISKINIFTNDYKKIKIYLTCRILYYDRHKEYFNNNENKFLRLYGFENFQIREYLKSNEINDDQIDQLNRNFIKGWNYVIIQTPRYLNLLIKYVKENGFENLSDLNRISLMDYFIYSKLNKEDATTTRQNKEYTKRVLEKLALTMEIYQTNTLSKDDLMTFFDDVDSRMVSHFLTVSSQEEFYDNSLLKNNIDSIEFENTEFQEYLAAKELSRLSKFEQSIFDVSVEAKKREIYPNWFNVLSYAVEFKIELLNEILNFGFRNNVFIDKEYFQLITNVNLNFLDDFKKDEIFKKVIEYHQKNNLRLEYEIARNLSFYFLSSRFSYIDEGYNSFIKKPEKFLMQIINIFSIYNQLLDRKILTEEQRQIIIDRWINILSNPHYSSSLKRNIMYTAQYLKDDGLLIYLYDLAKNSSDDSLIDAIINICIEINPNHHLTLELILNSLNDEDRHAHTYYGISLITSKNAFIKLFEELLNNDDLAEAFYKSESDAYISRLINNLTQVLDQELLTILEKVYFSSNMSDYNYYAHRSKFLRSLGLLLFEQDNNFVYRLIDEISATHDEGKSFWREVPMFDKIINENNVLDFIRYCRKKVQEGENLAAYVLTMRFHSQDPQDKKVYVIGREHFPDHYNEFEQNVQKARLQNDESAKEQKDFNFFIQLLSISTNERFYPNCFNLFEHSHEIIEKCWDSTQKAKFIDLLTYVLTTFDPGKTDLKINKADENGTSYSTHKWINFYGECIKCAAILGLNSFEFRHNIINYVPFAFWDTLLKILELTLPFSEIELQRLTNVYIDKEKDLWEFKPDNFFEILSRNKPFLPALDVVKQFVELEDIKDLKFLLGYRMKALEVTQYIQKDKNYLEEVFKKYLRSENNKILSIRANAMLISKFMDEKAVKWRIKELLLRKFKHTYSTSSGGYYVTQEENELSHKSFTGPLYSINDEKYLLLFLNLLRQSFKIIKQDNSYYNYAVYIQDVILKYFDNLKHYKDYKYLDILENECNKLVNLKGMDIFIEKFNGIKVNYFNYIGKPDSFIDCVKKYNTIKKSDYLKISSSRELFELIKELLQNDFSKWIFGEAKKVLRTAKSNETDLQKILSIKMESLLFERGFRTNEIRVFREIQSLDDSRPDFLIGYGFVAPILVELKLSSNSDFIGNKLFEKKSYTNISRYMNNFKVSHAILLIFDNKDRKKKLSWDVFYKKIESTYSKIKNVEVLGIPNIYKK